MNRYYVMFTALLLCLSLGGCTTLGAGLEQRPLTVEEQIQAAEIGLAFAQLAYTAYMEQRDTSSPDDAERGQALMQNVFDYIDRIQELQERQQEINQKPSRE